MIENLINQHADLFTQLGLHFLWQATAIAVLAWTICRFVLNSPRQRSAVYLLSLFAMLLAVPATLAFLPTLEPISLEASAADSKEGPVFVSDVPIASAGILGVGKEAGILRSYASWIVGGYLFGLLFMMVRVAQGYRWSSKVRRSGEKVKEDNWTEALASAVESMQLKTRPLMIWSEGVVSPVVTGFLRPMIVLPVSLMSGLPKEQAIAVLSHELAHLRRLDHLAVFFQRFLEALFFFHPAVWFVSRRLDQEREKACDDLVMSAGTDPSEYARTLVRCASEQPQPQPQPQALALAAANTSQLKERVLRILGQPETSSVGMNRGGWLTIAMTILALGFVTLTPAQSEEKEAKPNPEEVINPIAKKLGLILPALDLKNATLVEAIDFLRIRSIELDQGPNKKTRGLNFVVRIGKGKTNIADAKIDRLTLRNTTLREALNAICQKTKMKYRIEPFAVVIIPAGSEFGELPMATRVWVTKKDFLESIHPKDIDVEITAKDTLLARGVKFPKGSSANFVEKGHQLTVRNTPANLEAVDQLVKSVVPPVEPTEEQKAEIEANKKALSVLQSMILPTVDFNDVKLEEALKFLQIRSRELDSDKKGVTIKIQKGNVDLAGRKISGLSLKNVPLLFALQYSCKLTKTRFKLEGRTVTILPLEK